MTQVVTNPAGTRTNLTTTAMNSLASATYVSCGIIDTHTLGAIDLVVEVEVTPGTVTAPSGCYVFAKASFDGSNYGTGPESGTTTTDEPNLKILGFLPCNTNSTLERGSFNVKDALGVIPPYLKIIIKNTTGAALASSGHAVNYTTYTGLIT